MTSNQEKSLAIRGHEERLSDSPYVEKIGRIRADTDYSSLCPADVHWNMLLVKYQGKTSLSVWGPMTKAADMAHVEGAEFLFITFKLGTFIPHLPAKSLLDAGEFLPEASSKSFWLDGSAWQFPDYENADTFVDWLVRDGLLVHEPIVDAMLQNQRQAMSLRSAQRRFLQATGLTQRYIRYVERARRAAALLQQGVSILDTVYEAGYFDQAHFIKDFKMLVGKPPVKYTRQMELVGQE